MIVHTHAPDAPGLPHGREAARFRDAGAGLRGRARLGLAGVLAALLVVSLASAAEAAPLRRLGQNPRGLAMGGTGISYADDEMALYYNPAGLGSIDNWWVELTPLAIEASKEAVDLASQGDIGNFDNPADLIKNNLGKEIQLRAFAYPTGVFNVMRGMTLGVGYFYEAQSEMKFRNLATPEADAFYRLDQGNVLGASVAAGEGKYLFGISRRSIQRQTGEGTLSSAQLALASAKGNLDLTQSLDIKEGKGTGYDLGLIWRIETFSSLRGQFGFVIQNAGGTKLGDAGKIPQEVAMGWTIRPEWFQLTPVMMALEFRDMTKALSDDKSLGKRTHFGLEVGVLPMDGSTNLFTLRAGYNAGKLSYGADLSLWHSLTIQYVVYYQEFGETAGQDPRLRQLLQVNLLGF